MNFDPIISAALRPFVHRHFPLPFSIQPARTQIMTAQEFVEKMSKYAIDRPVKFVGLATFAVLGGIPMAVFAAYAIATVIASVIGALIVEIVLLGIGITGLAFILFFVTCITVGVVSVFTAVYYSYSVATNSIKKGASRFRFQPVPPETLTEQTEETADKNKSPELIVDIATLMSREFPTHDFLRSALLTLVLVCAIVGMSLVVLVTAYFVVQFT